MTTQTIAAPDRLRRPIADVALSMRRYGLWYPERAAERAGGEEDDRLDRLLRGLLRASEALATVPAEIVEFEDLLRDPEALRSAFANSSADVSPVSKIASRRSRLGAQVFFCFRGPAGVAGSFQRGRTTRGGLPCPDGFAV